MTPRYDFAVAGSGAAGCALAARLVEGGARVLLIEEGGEALPPADPMESLYRHYAQSGLAAATGNCLIPLPTGIAVGGTTKINSGTCLKTPRELLRAWELRSSGGFCAASFEGHLQGAWERLNVRRAPSETMSSSSRLFLLGLERLGVPGGHLLARAERGCVGSGRCCFVCPKGAKLSADLAFLEPVRGRPGFELLERTSLERIREEPDKVRLGLRGPGGRARSIDCERLILSCGALKTPYFLRRFRLGQNYSMAGDGLSVHPAAKVFACFDERLDGSKGVPQGAGLLDPEEPRLRYEGAFVPPALAAVALSAEGRGLRWWLDRYDRLASFGFMVKDSSRGRVRYPLGRGFPLIRYRLVGEDLGLMVRGMRFLAKVFFAAGARRVVLPLNRGKNAFDSREELESADFSAVSPWDLQMAGFHPLGTCGMGRVVGPDLKLSRRIYVCDGSVIPESLGVNPQVTIYAFALRLAEHLLGVSNGE